MMVLTEQMRSRSVDFDQALRELAVLLHRVAVAQTVPGAIVDDAERALLEPYARSMDAESVQLAYQIVVQGCNDLPMAPDEVTGFSMTLLRLLAFRPENPAPLGASSRGQSAALQALPREAHTRAPVRAVQVPPSPAEPAVRSTNPAPATAAFTESFCVGADEGDTNGLLPRSNEEWHALVDALDIVALTRQLAHQCEWLGSDGGALRLRLPRDMAHLVTSAQDKLRAALQAKLDAVPAPLRTWRTGCADGCPAIERRAAGASRAGARGDAERPLRAAGHRTVRCPADRRFDQTTLRIAP
jgi:DNA polymerase-3 subunit gamma/tau